MRLRIESSPLSLARDFIRMYTITSTIENGFVHLPDRAPWLGEYLHELTTFLKGKYDDQADSTSQALDWFKNNSTNGEYGLIEYWKKEEKRIKAAQQPVDDTRVNAVFGLEGRDEPTHSRRPQMCAV